MRERCYNRVERAERVENGANGEDFLTQRRKGAENAKSWPMVRLGDVCEVIAGQSPEGKYYTTDSSYTEFHQGCKAFGTKYLLSSNVYTKEISKLASAGSIVMSVRAPVGTVNITRSEICIGRGLCAFKLSQKVDREYLYYYLLSSKKYLDDVAGAGTVFPSISRKQLVEIQIPLPPLEVQKEIVERLEKELGEADKVAANFRKIAEMADAEFKAELDETFGELERREFLTQRRKGAESAESACPMVRLGDVCEEIRERISVDEVPLKNYITTDNMLKGCGGVRVAESVPFEGSLVKYQIGDVLISNIRPYLKKAWLADRDGGCSSDVIVFRSRRIDLFNEYLYKALSQDGFFEYSMLNVSGTKMPRGKREWIKEFQIPLPPLSVQKGIVAKLDAAKERCEKLKAAAERGLTAAQNLRKAILSEAFE